MIVKTNQLKEAGVLASGDVVGVGTTSIPLVARLTPEARAVAIVAREPCKVELIASYAMMWAP